MVRAYLTARWRGTVCWQDLDDTFQEVFVECFRPGGPLDRAPWQGGDVDCRGLRELTNKLMSAIQALTKQEYVLRYAPKRKDQETPSSSDAG